MRFCHTKHTGEDGWIAPLHGQLMNSMLRRVIIRAIESDQFCGSRHW